MKNKLIKIFSILLCVICIFSTVSVDAIVSCSDPDRPQNEPCIPDSTTDRIENVITTTNKFWASVVTIVQVVAVGCVVFAGVRYMFASADQKADIKKGLMYLVIGAIFVFSTATVIRFIFDIGNDIIT